MEYGPRRCLYCVHWSNAHYTVAELEAMELNTERRHGKTWGVLGGQCAAPDRIMHGAHSKAVCEKWEGRAPKPAVVMARR